MYLRMLHIFLLCAIFFFSLSFMAHYSICLYSEWFYQYHNSDIISNEWCFWQITLNLTAFAMLVNSSYTIFYTLFITLFSFFNFCARQFSAVRILYGFVLISLFVFLLLSGWVVYSGHLLISICMENSLVFHSNENFNNNRLQSTHSTITVGALCHLAWNR